MKRKASRRVVVVKKKKTRLTASAINRALTSVRKYRGQDLLAISSGAAGVNSDFPITLRPPSSGTYSSGYALFTGPSYAASGTRLTTIAGDAVNASSVPATFADPVTAPLDNGLKFHGNWAKGQIRNCALNPVVLEIYDLICVQDLAVSLASFNNSLSNYIMNLIFSDLSAKMDAVTDLPATVRDTGEIAYNAANAAAFGFFMTNDWVGPGVSQALKEYFRPSKVHKVVLAPGQSYIWKVKGFKPYTYYATTDSNNRAVKGQTYIPLIKVKGEIGLTSAGAIGYTAHSLAIKFDWGVKAYAVTRNMTRAIGTSLPTMPASGQSVLGPSEEVQAA